MEPLRVLCSFAMFRGDKLQQFLDRWHVNYPDVPLKIFGDSGAFTFATTGQPAPIAEYAEWCVRYRDVLECYANYDVIGDPDASQRNLDTLHALGVTPVPVFHKGSDFAVLERLTREHSFVAIGGLVGHATRGRFPRAFAARCLMIAQEHECRLHAFGMTGAPALTDFPWASADSSSWVGAARFMRPMFFTTVRGRPCLASSRIGALGAASGTALLPFVQNFREVGLALESVTALRTGAAVQRTLLDQLHTISVLSTLRFEAYLHTRHPRVSPPLRIYFALSGESNIAALACAWRILNV